MHAFGGSDPFWSDGCNLNLVRNHIFYYKRKIEETMKPGQYPAIYHRNDPPEVDRDYMARSDEIRANAKKSLAIYKNNPDYLFLCRRALSLTPKDRKKTCIDNIINYVVGLEQAIGEDDLIVMRRHENAERYFGSFPDCAERVRKLKPPENEQLSLFADYSDYDMEEF